MRILLEIDGSDVYTDTLADSEGRSVFSLYRLVKDTAKKHGVIVLNFIQFDT